MHMCEKLIPHSAFFLDSFEKEEGSDEEGKEGVEEERRRHRYYTIYFHKRKITFYKIHTIN